MDTYIVNKAAPDMIPAIDEGWDAEAWKAANTVKIQWHWHECKGPFPEVEAKLLHDGRTIYGIFQVKDHSVLGRAMAFNDQVCFDSCVEFFFRPLADKGYLNLEMSAGGAFLCYFVRDCTRTSNGFADFDKLPPQIGEKIVTLGTTGLVPQERQGDNTWQMRFQIPPAVTEHFLGDLGDLSGQQWTGNFYKCGDKLANPHWMAWQPVPVLNFHLPDSFGKIRFA